MGYRRFRLPEVGLSPATVATLATVRADEGESVATVASVATQKPDERGSAPGSVASVAIVARVGLDVAHPNTQASILSVPLGVPDTWTEDLSSLILAEPFEGFSRAAWEQLIEDGSRFIDRWGAEAARLGWNELDLFGVHPLAPGVRYDSMGLVPLIRGGEVVGITATGATIRMSSGSELIYLRQPRPGAVALWELRPCGSRLGEEAPHSVIAGQHQTDVTRSRQAVIPPRVCSDTSERNQWPARCGSCSVCSR